MCSKEEEEGTTARKRRVYLYQCSSRGHQTLMRAPTAACFRMAIWAPEWPAAAAAAALLVRHLLWFPCTTISHQDLVTLLDFSLY